ncbi:MAG: LuxR family transcriptional regulator [Alphaproteobacteria bacterium]
MFIEDFIDQSNSATTPDELIRYYVKAIGQLGFDKYTYSLCAKSAQLKLGKHAGLVGNYPQEWMDHYNKNSCIDYDPVYKKSIIYREAFPWSKFDSIPLSKREKAIMDGRREVGLRNGVSALIRGPLGELVGVSVANGGPEEPIDQNKLSRLFVLMQQFHLRFIDLMSSPLVLPRIEISDREKEVLVWASRGKSNGDIASIIGVSKKTVEFHFSSIFKKLQVNSRVLAILQGMYLRLIVP